MNFLQIIALIGRAVEREGVEKRGSRVEGVVLGQELQ